MFFNCSYQDQEKTFIQISSEVIETEIATINVPNAKVIYPKDLQNQEISQIFSQNQDITMYSFMHSSSTVSVSYLEFMEQFAITYHGYTVILENEEHVNRWNPPKSERYFLVVFSFFGILKKFSNDALKNFKKDLSNRSLIGMCCYKSIQWLGLVEHYGQDKLLSPHIVKNFLQKYDLEFVFIRCYQNVSLNSLPFIYDEIRNQYIFDFNDMNQGSTIYFWNSKQYLGSYFIPHKHYEILENVKRMLMDWKNKSNPFTFLNEYNLNNQDLDFYKNYINRILHEQNQPQLTFSTLTSIIFNSILSGSEKTTYKQNNRYPLSFCINPTIIVLIPLGFNQSGFERLFQQLQQIFFFVNKITSPGQITNKYQICYFNRSLSWDNSIKLIDQLKKKKNVVTVGLMHQNNHQQYKLNSEVCFPFSYEYISQSLIESSNNYQDFQENIEILLSYRNQDLRQLPVHELLCIPLQPDDQQSKRNSKLCQEQDIQEIIFNKDLNVEQMRSIFFTLRQHQLHLTDHYFQILSYDLIADIESQLKIFLQNPKMSKSYIIITTQQYKPIEQKQKPLQYIITDDSWKEIEDYVLDSLELVGQKFRQSETIAQTISCLTDQFLASGPIVYNKNLIPFNIHIKGQKAYSAKMQMVVIVLNAIIIMIPENTKLFQGITIYTKQLEAQHMNEILHILKDNIQVLQRENVEMRSVLNQQFSLKNQQWNAYIVKFSSTEIKFKNINQE
ncbi:unnamed protein product (macronuclear) [Paramecium tetraurelia]|uniref:Uncharacterized protein n=1 Tax=Paramecium tetraurelia TaxID=5888 RepID=A0CMD9_PARTE|nr:uncharacterized protein GSPATT00008435001 [Paramecium tetraurelia]CAK71956.1 unnamed protein product [Paramecium tetraurelia]|eukprot:XP_001439353.1 hypothetical protein (macronuclear) [Paramecium tetraurelia strain d4-2]